MKLTPFGKFFLALVVLVVAAYIGYRRFGGELRNWAGKGEATKTEQVNREDFRDLKDFTDAPRNGDVPVNPQGGSVGGGKLNRPLKVAINTWAGHSPGIVANGGLEVGS